MLKRRLDERLVGLLVFSLPMRDGNRNAKKGWAVRTPVFSLPMRDGNPLNRTSAF